jgi:hypothetical protein
MLKWRNTSFWRKVALDHAQVEARQERPQCQRGCSQQELRGFGRRVAGHHMHQAPLDWPNMEEQLFQNRALTLGFDPTRSHPGVAPIFHMLLENATLVPFVANVFDSCLSWTITCFPTLLHNVPSAATLSGIWHVIQNGFGDLVGTMRNLPM